MRRIFKIIIILLLVIAIILTVSWLISRRQAVKEGRVAPTFKAFLTRDTSSSRQPVSEGSGLTPEESVTPTPTEDPLTVGSDNISTPGIGTVEVSQFTSSPIMPSNNLGGTGFGTGTSVSGSGVSGGGLSGGGSTSGGPILPAPPVISPPAPISGPACRDEDINIAFTSEEIRRLGELQDQFVAIADTIRTDADVQAELANYTAFRAKANTAVELYNYCLNTSPRITDALLRVRMPTPFWRGTGDVQGYISRRSLSDNILVNTMDPRNINISKAAFERIFRINLW